MGERCGRWYNFRRIMRIQVGGAGPDGPEDDGITVGNWVFAFWVLGWGTGILFMVFVGEVARR